MPIYCFVLVSRTKFASIIPAHNYLKGLTYMFFLLSPSNFELTAHGDTFTGSSCLEPTGNTTQHDGTSPKLSRMTIRQADQTTTMEQLLAARFSERYVPCFQKNTT